MGIQYYKYFRMQLNQLSQQDISLYCKWLKVTAGD